MQSERVQICSKKLLQRGITWSKFVPLEQEASVEDILSLFAKFILDGTSPPHPILVSCFQTLLQSQNECMFVFMRRGVSKAAGILRSNKPLCSQRELDLLKQVGHTKQWNIPLWTWSEEHHDLLSSMERQCRQQSIAGPCIGVWCYR